MDSNFADFSHLRMMLYVTDRPSPYLRRGLCRCIIKYMSFLLEAQRDLPTALYMMDDTSPFQDYSGYDGAGTVLGTETPTTHISLVSGAKYATVLGPTFYARFDSRVFKSGQESSPFTLEATVRTYDAAAHQILGNLNQMDGLVIEGTKISFVTKYSTAPEARVTHDLQHARAVHIVGVHTADKNSLYVNGELVGETTLTEEQQSDLYASTDNYLYSGLGASGTVALNGVAAYPSALTGETIARHYLIISDTPEEDDVAVAMGGTNIPVSLSNSNIFLDQWWSSADEWSSASLFNVSVVGDKLVPQFDGDTSLTGVWMDSFALDSADSVSIQGVVLNWDGDGVIVEASLDGTSWSSVSRGGSVSIIPPGFNPTDKELIIRVTFAGGVINDSAFLDSLNAVGILTPTTPAVNGRTVTYNSAHPERDYRPLELHDNWGAEVGTNGSLVISADSSGGAARTVEAWVKSTRADGAVFSGTGTLYQNGNTGGTGVEVGEWVLCHFVLAADSTSSITINGPVQIGHVVIYDTALTAAQIASIYGEYTNSATVRINDAGGVTVSETGARTKIYEYDWAIVSTP